MNLALRGIDADLGDRADDSFHRDHFPDLRADFILANPPFNKDDWFSDALATTSAGRTACRRRATPTSRGSSTSSTTSPRTAPPASCSPTGRCRPSSPARARSAASSSRPTWSTASSRCPEKLFFNTGIPVSLWFVAKNRHGNGHRARQGEVLFIDARKLGRMETRTLRVLDDADVAEVADTYHAWRAREPPSAVRGRARLLQGRHPRRD